MTDQLHLEALACAHRTWYYAGLNPFKASYNIRHRIAILQLLAILEEWDENRD